MRPLAPYEGGQLTPGALTQYQRDPAHQGQRPGACADGCAPMARTKHGHEGRDRAEQPRHNSHEAQCAKQQDDEVEPMLIAPLDLVSVSADVVAELSNDGGQVILLLIGGEQLIID